MLRSTGGQPVNPPPTKPAAGEGAVRRCGFLQCGGDVYDFRETDGTLCFKTDAADAGCGGVALLCLDPTTDAGVSRHLGCTRDPTAQPFRAAGPFPGLDQVRFPDE